MREVEKRNGEDFYENQESEKIYALGNIERDCSGSKHILLSRFRVYDMVKRINKD